MTGPAELYMHYLANEGFQPKIDGDGDVVFKCEGKTYYIDIDTEDPQFFRLVFPQFWSVDSDEEFERIRNAANEANLKTKVTKVYIVTLPSGKDTCAAIEIFLEKPEQFEAIFPRAMRALQAGVRTFVETVQG